MNTPITDPPSATFATMAPACVKREATVFHPDGLHIQPANELAALAHKFRSVIRIVADGRRYLAGSTIDILSAHLHYGKQLTVEAEGPDAAGAVAALERFFKRRSQPLPLPRQVLPASGTERLPRAA